MDWKSDVRKTSMPPKAKCRFNVICKKKEENPRQLKKLAKRTSGWPTGT